MYYNKCVKNKLKLINLLLLIGMLISVSASPVAAQAAGSSQYFPDTGHNVSGEFLFYYLNTPNAHDVYGSPITEQFTDETSGRLVQYFQRVRFDYFPEAQDGMRVHVAELGSMVYQKIGDSGSLGSGSLIGCRSFANGFSVCYAFLEFFDKNGGEAIFGQPISPFLSHNGRIVQYFERARFEWYPENPDGLRVRLAELGRIYFDMIGEDPFFLQPVKSADNTVSAVTTLTTHAFTWKAVTRLDDDQAVYVVVQDQTLSPISGATVIVTINWPNGETMSLAQTTNQAGFVSVPVQVRGQLHGSLVTIRVEVLYEEKSSTTTTSFRVWQ